jgi:hypothetical protein
MDVRLNVEVYSYYEGKCPTYRIYVNDHLYNEREFWVDCLVNLIEEEIFVDIDYGKHTLTIEKIMPPQAKIWVEKITLSYNNTIREISFPINPQDKQIIEFNIE